ncbi:hypothetical protein FQJ95_13280 [Xanthomonas vasicola]|nr:hypothetical protein FQJ95_13280 [Xanthomonas vasicola]
MKRFVGSLMALSLLTSGAAVAAPQQQEDLDHDRSCIAQHKDDHGPDRRDDHRDDRHDDRRDDRRNAHDDRNDRRGDNTYVLIAVATGLITSVVAGR